MDLSFFFIVVYGLIVMGGEAKGAEDWHFNGTEEELSQHFSQSRM